MTIAEPGGCRWCGIPERRHYQQWSADAGWHPWQPPTTEQTLNRMRARRAERNTR